jgi:hypothetical protein
MKKIFTLIFALALFSAADAQRGSRDKRGDNDRYDNRNVVINDGRYDNRNNRSRNNRYNAQRSMQIEIARINRDYAYKIDRVKDDRHLRRKEKRRIIRHLEEERQQQIRRVYARHNNRGGPHARIQIHF